MPLSTSSSERILPEVSWLPALLTGLLVAGVVAAIIEYRLAELGYKPTARDSAAKWMAERARAATLGERALILVGASRFQVGLDLEVLRRETGLEPVQLAIDGSAGGPVLENLSRDPAIRGTILFDYYGYGLGGEVVKSVRQYETTGGRTAWFDHPSMASEEYLDDWLRERLRLYADDSNPLSALRFRVVPAVESRQYLVTKPDRSRLVDYSRVAMPEAYYGRVLRTLGENMDAKSPAIAEQLRERIAHLLPADPTPVKSTAAALADITALLRARGGNLIMVVMPTSGMVREIEMRRYPRTQFLDRLLAESGVVGIDTQHDQDFSVYICPDGSHLDMRDRAGFTHELVAALRRRGVGKS